MTLTFIQDGSIISAANYPDKKSIRSVRKKYCSVGEGDMKRTRYHYMRYTTGHNYVKTGRKITVPFSSLEVYKFIEYTQYILQTSNMR